MAQRGVNKVILVGHVGKDPELRYTQSSTPVCSLSVATSETWKDKHTGEQQEKTEWHRVIFWRQLAEIVGKYVRKGSQIYVEGRLETRKWQDNNGQDRYTTEIIANTMQMLGGGSSTQDRPAQGAAQSASDQFQQPPTAGGDDFDDDIPF